MTFVHPLFLWALVAVAVPVIIHLFNFRKYKIVYFTNVKFLKDLQEESKSKSRLKELLILLCRCLAITCLVLAFCQPVLQNSAGKGIQVGANAISLYIDNSFSTQNVNKQGPVFEIARTRAREVVRAFGGADRFQIISNDFEGKHQRMLTREDALSAIDELTVSSNVRPLSDVIKRQTEFISSAAAPNKKLFIFSDAQKSTFNLAAVKPDTSMPVTLVTLSPNRVNNIFIDSCWFESPIQQQGFIQKLHASILNKGNNKLDIGSAKLFIDKQQVALASYSLEPGSKTEVVFTFECKKSGFNFGSIKIEDYPVTFDDELFFAFNSRINIAVSLINGKDVNPNNEFSRLFKSDSIFKLSTCTEQTIDYASFKTSDVLILNQLSELSSGLQSELSKFTSQGGAVLIIPALNANVGSYNNTLNGLKMPLLGAMDSSSIKTDKIELASKFYAGVFEKTEERINLPLVTKHFRLIKSNKTDFESILILQNAEDFFGRSSLNNALLYLLTSPLNSKSGNFGMHALFVPTLYRLCFSAIKPLPLFYPVSENVVINLKNDADAAEQPPHIKQLDNTADMIPEMRVVNNSLYLYTRNQVSNPGFYEVNRGGQLLMPLAFNYSRKESDLENYTEEELAAIIKTKGWSNFSLLADNQSDISNQVLQADGGQKLWKLFILLALGFVLLEIAFLRLLK